MYDLTKLGGLIKNKSVNISIDYGSGGFSVKLVHKLSGQVVNEYSWDIEGAVTKAFTEMELLLENELNNDDLTPVPPQPKTLK